MSDGTARRVQSHHAFRCSQNVSCDSSVLTAANEKKIKCLPTANGQEKPDKLKHVVLTLKSVDEILKFGHSNESY